jgi:hypothetical protein
MKARFVVTKVRTAKDDVILESTVIKWLTRTKPNYNTLQTDKHMVGNYLSQVSANNIVIKDYGVILRQT